MKLCIQDPSYKDSMYLQESLLTACEVGISGGGAYAFASKDGIELFLEDESFKKFMDSGTFFLMEKALALRGWEGEGERYL